MTDENLSIEVSTIAEAEVLGEFVDTVLPAELDRAVTTAKEYPRSIEEARKTLYTLATLERTEVKSEKMFYSLRRGGKMIEGASIRFAECVMSSWGNLRVYGRGVDIGATTLVAEGYAWDLQSNTAVGKRVTRRITDRNGNRYNADLITMTENAAVSIAIRNAILTIVPRPLWTQAYNASLDVFAGTEKEAKTHRKEWVTWWEKQGGTKDQLWEYLDIKGPDDIGGFELRSLHGLRTSITEGVTTFQREMDILGGEEIPEEEAASLDAMLTAEDGDA